MLKTIALLILVNDPATGAQEVVIAKRMTETQCMAAMYEIWSRNDGTRFNDPVEGGTMFAIDAACVPVNQLQAHELAALK